MIIIGAPNTHSNPPTGFARRIAGDEQAYLCSLIVLIGMTWYAKVLGMNSL